MLIRFSSVPFCRMGFFWGACCTFIFFALLIKRGGFLFFFYIPSSWVIVDELSLLIEVLVLVVFVIRISCRVKDLTRPVKEIRKGLDRSLLFISLPCVLFFCVGG